MHCRRRDARDAANLRPARCRASGSTEPRLTRSLSDFARIVEVFDAHGVSFVSVTQQFNTTTSMGRLTLNMLLSFAQFEREVTGQRIRDKIAASRKKGLWMGGHPALGYDVKDRKLVVNAQEAETVRRIFRRYVDLGSVYKLKSELDRQGIMSKTRISSTGRMWGGRPIVAGALYQMLQNPTYIGKAAHKGKVYDGQHEAIVDLELWTDVQEKIKANCKRRRNGANAKEPRLLAGLLFDADGKRLTPSHAVKNGRRYRYYVSRFLIVRAADAPQTGGWRIPAHELETVVTARLSHILKDQAGLIDLLALSAQHMQSIETVVAAASEKAEALEKGSMPTRHALLRDIVQRIIVSDDSVRLIIRISALGRRLGLT